MDIFDKEKLEVKRNTHLGEGVDEVELYNYNGVQSNNGILIKMSCNDAMDLGVRLIRASRNNYRQ